MVLRYLLKMPRKVLNLELSSGAFSTAALEGVAARELSRELRADVVAEPGWAFSGARSAMVAGIWVLLKRVIASGDRSAKLYLGNDR